MFLEFFMKGSKIYINKKQIKTTYLINEYSKDDKKIRLKPVKDDKEAFSKLFGQEEDYIPDSNITVNFQYFYNRLQEEEISVLRAAGEHTGE